MICAKCGARLPQGFDAKYCLVCQEKTEALKAWIDKILEEKQKSLEVY